MVLPSTREEGRREREREELLAMDAQISSFFFVGFRKVVPFGMPDLKCGWGDCLAQKNTVGSLW